MASTKAMPIELGKNPDVIGLKSKISNGNINSFMPKVIKIIAVVLFLYIILLLVFSYLGMMRSSPILVKKETPTLKNLSFLENKLPLSDVDGGLSWSFVSWLYVEDWNYRYGQKKTILSWGYNVLMYFDEKNNDLHIDVLTLPSGKVESLVYKDIPLQRWFSIIVVLDGRNLDLFIDGKLVANKFLNEVPHYLPSELILFDEGGFRGKIGYLQYLNYRIPQFGINHFQGLEKKFNNSSLRYSFYNQFWFGIAFGFKSNFQKMLIVGNRNFKRMNFLSVDILTNSLLWIKQLLTSFFDFINRMIFRWA